MAKRRKLEAPSPEDLTRLEEEFRRDSARGPMSAPIAQVAAEAATHHDPRPAPQRAEAAKDRADAERLRTAAPARRVGALRRIRVGDDVHRPRRALACIV